MPIPRAFLLIGLLLLGAPAWAETAQEQANKKTVLEFYEAAINQKDFDKAAPYIGSRYTQHNPNAADGPE
ncbi:MAG TPA: hypothetical protein VLX85_13855, partial [Stellaceae bacterium]|nr:hypothetical protein [Stellaceae bacterium]